jgi:hypothetical protein
MRRSAGLRWLRWGLRHDPPVEEGEEGSVALHQRISIEQVAHGVVVKTGRRWYDEHGQKLLAGSSMVYYFHSSYK